MSFTVGIEVTKRCNFTCEHCFVDAGAAAPIEWTTDQLKRLLRDLRTCQTHTVAWSGGEPLIRKDLEELTMHARRLGMAVGLASNGFLASRQRLVSLQACGLGVVQISLDGPDAERASRWRQGPSASFDRALQAIRDSAELGMRTYVCALLSPETAAEIEDMLRLARELGAHGLRYTMWAPVGRATGQAYDERAWASKEVRRFFQVYQRERQRGDLEILIDCPTGPFVGRESFRCGAGRDSAYIRENGDLYPCTALMFDAFKVGNVRQQPVAELLFDGGMLRPQKQMATHLPGGACTACTVIESCRGGCPGRTYAVTGALFDGPDQGAMPCCLLRLLSAPAESA